MKPLDPPKTIKIYQLLKQSGMYFSNMGSVGGQHSLGLGFYSTLHEAEMNRTLEVLKLTEKDNGKIHIFELEVPNPAYKEVE
jgi:hypothetical protein